MTVVVNGPNGQRGALGFPGPSALSGFKEFLFRGNVVDLAVAVVIGTAFAALVTSFSRSFLEPLIGLVSGGGQFGGVFRVDGQEFTYGAFISQVISFVLTAAVVYFVVVLPLHRLLARRLLQRAAWLDEQVELVRNALSTGREADAIATLNGYSMQDIQRVVTQLSKEHRARVKALLADFIGKFDVERIRTAIAIVEGGGSAELVSVTERAHTLIREGRWEGAYKLLFVEGSEAIRRGALQRLSSGHLRALMDNVTLWETGDGAQVAKVRAALSKEAQSRSGFRASDGRDFSDSKKVDETGGFAAIDARGVRTPSAKVTSILLEGPDDARYRLALHSWREDSTDMVGHAWIGVDELKWPMRRFTFGFWPGSAGGVKGMVFGAKGTLHSPDPHAGQELVSRTKTGTRAEIKALLPVVQRWEGEEYALFGANCARFATDAWRAMTGEDQTGDDWFFTSPSDIRDRGPAKLPEATPTP
ncbi:MAG: MscL family protein [Actinomycetota bacterium]|nr:MscL family protein [Actinomycetota bacterium]